METFFSEKLLLKTLNIWYLYFIRSLLSVSEQIPGADLFTKPRRPIGQLVHWSAFKYLKYLFKYINIDKYKINTNLYININFKYIFTKPRRPIGQQLVHWPSNISERKKEENYQKNTKSQLRLSDQLFLDPFPLKMNRTLTNIKIADNSKKKYYSHQKNQSERFWWYFWKNIWDPILSPKTQATNRVKQMLTQKI